MKSKNVSQTKTLHCKPIESIKMKTKNTGKNAAIWKYQKH